MTNLSASNTSKPTILVTGGLGFIGSHCAQQLLERNYKVVIVDSLVNADAQVEDKIRGFFDADKQADLSVYHIDLRDRTKLEEVFTNHPITGVIHFAALKAVGESVKQPLRYYNNNLIGTLTLLEVMNQFNVNNIIFSSSATVYGDAKLPFTEDEEQIARASCPYGQTKIDIEYILEDVSRATDLKAICLRYFNPVGAHPSGKLGEELTALNNIFPYLSAIYLGQKEHLVVFGSDYPTKDGTCERDYIHIMDLIDGHILALEYLLSHDDVKFDAFNLGSGEALSVLEICQAFDKYSDRPIKYILGDRREGDLPILQASPIKAEKVLGFRVKRNLQQMVEDTIRFLKTYENK